METFKHGHNARIAAYIDCVLIGIMIIILLATGVVLGAKSTISIEEDPSKSKNTEKEASLTIVWIVLVISIVVAFGFANGWAVVNMLRATKKGAEASAALRKCQNWGCVATFCTLLTTFGLVLKISFNSFLLMLVLQIAVRGPLSYFVFKFGHELHEYILENTTETKNVSASPA